MKILRIVALVNVLAFQGVSQGQNALQKRGSEKESGCPFTMAPLLAIEDLAFADSMWVPEIIKNTAAPNNPWTLDVARQSLTDGQAPAGNPPPGRWIRYSYSGAGNLSATIEVATWYTTSIVPAEGGIQAIQFDFDNWGTGIRVGPMLLQDSTYYSGPSFVINRNDGWVPYSSGCLTAVNFEKIEGPGPDRPDLSQSMIVGYMLTSTTNRTLDIRDNVMDNFRVFVDGNFTLGDPPPIPNRAPFAVDDVIPIETNFHGQATGTKRLALLSNDADPDGDLLSIKGFTQPQYGRVSLISGFSNLWYTQTAISPTSTDHFTYTVTDGMLEATASVFVIYDHACAITGSIAQRAQATLQNSLDLNLIRRFRDEVLRPTSDGARYVDYYYNSATEILKILVIDQPDLGAKAVEMVELLQPAIRDILDGDGNMPITQTQMDTVTSFLENLAAAGSDSLQQLIADELTRLGPLGNYVGVRVQDVLSSVLGDSIATGITDDQEAAPRTFVLHQNFPNPFNPETTIQFRLERTTLVKLRIYDVKGRMVKTLVDGASLHQGQHEFTWNADDNFKRQVATGIYFYRLEAGDRVKTRKMVLLR